VNFSIVIRTPHQTNLSNFRLAYLTSVYLLKVHFSVALEKVFPPKLIPTQSVHFFHINHLDLSVLGAFAKLQKVTVRFLMSCLSVLHGTAGLLLDELL
jgi:hypothetical protein